MAILPTSCSGAAWRMWVSASSERPSRWAEPGGQRGDALGVLARVVVAVLGGEREPAQHLDPHRLEVAPAADGLGGERGLEVARAAIERGAVEQRAQPQHRGVLVVVAARIEVGGGDQRRAGAQLERVEQLAQLALGAAERDDHVGRPRRAPPARRPRRRRRP